MITQRIVIQIRDSVTRRPKYLVGVDVTTSINGGLVSRTCDIAEAWDQFGRMDVQIFKKELRDNNGRLSEGLLEDIAVDATATRQIVAHM